MRRLKDTSLNFLFYSNCSFFLSFPFQFNRELIVNKLYGAYSWEISWKNVEIQGKSVEKIFFIAISDTINMWYFISIGKQALLFFLKDFLNGRNCSLFFFNNNGRTFVVAYLQFECYGKFHFIKLIWNVICKLFYFTFYSDVILWFLFSSINSIIAI